MNHLDIFGIFIAGIGFGIGVFNIINSYILNIKKNFLHEFSLIIVCGFVFAVVFMSN